MLAERSTVHADLYFRENRIGLRGRLSPLNEINGIKSSRVAPVGLYVTSRDWKCLVRLLLIFFHGRNKVILIQNLPDGGSISGFYTQ